MGRLLLAVALLGAAPQEPVETEPVPPVESEREDPAVQFYWPAPPDPQGLREGSDLLANDLLRTILRLAREPRRILDFTPRRFGPPPREPYAPLFERFRPPLADEASPPAAPDR